MAGEAVSAAQQLQQAKPAWSKAITGGPAEKLAVWREAKTTYELLLNLETVPGRSGQCWYVHQGAVVALLQLAALWEVPDTVTFCELVSRTMAVLPWSEILKHRHDAHPVEGEPLEEHEIPTFDEYVSRWQQATPAGSGSAACALEPPEFLVEDTYTEDAVEGSL